MELTPGVREQATEAAKRYRDTAVERDEVERQQERDGKKVVDTREQVEARFERLFDMPVNAILRSAPEQSAEAGHRMLERIIGERNELQSARFLLLGARTIQSTARIARRQGLRRLPLGTGFLVSPRVLMTNNHVLPHEHAASRAVAEFNYQTDADNVEGPVAIYELDPDTLFITASQLDYTLVALRPSLEGAAAGHEFGWSPLRSLQGKIITGESLNIVGHPSGRSKEITIRNGTLQFQHDEFLQYTTDTEPGNSGSPVFNDQWEVVALHHAGVPATDADGRWLKQDGTPWQPRDGDDAVHWIANEGARVSVLLDHISGQQVADDAQELLQEVLAHSGLAVTASTETAAPNAASPGPERFTHGDGSPTDLTPRGAPRSDVHLVFVHGRGQQGRDPQTLRRLWTAGLSKGLVLADMAPIDANDASFPFYGDVLAGQLDARETMPRIDGSSTAEALAPTDDGSRKLYEELLTEAAHKAGYPAESDVQEGLFDGVLGVLQRRLGWLANRSRLDEIVIATIFRDVAGYLSHGGVRDAVLDTVLDTVPTSGKIVLVGHSLGTVVAVDMITRLPDTVDIALFVTAGSPLGMDTVFNRALTRGAHRPNKVHNWVNVWSPADPIAIGCPLVDHWGTPLTEVITDNPTERAHAIDEYLADVRVAAAIGSSL